MRFVVKVSLAALFMTQSVSYALNPVQGWYGGVLIGANYTPSINFTLPNEVINAANSMNYKLPQFGTDGTLNYGIMGEIGGQLGYRCGKYRLEAQYFYNNSPLHSLQLGAFTLYQASTSYTTDSYVNGSTDSGFVMLNGFYDFLPSDPSSNFAPYVGLGAGYSYNSNNLKFFLFNNNTELFDTFQVREHMTSPAGQAILGVTYFLDDFASFGLDVRYLTTSKKDEALKARVQFYTINLSFNGAFQGA
jgi:hypothetical protein